MGHDVLRPNRQAGLIADADKKSAAVAKTETKKANDNGRQTARLLVRMLTKAI